MKLHVSWGLRARTCQPESKVQTERKPTNTKAPPIAGSFGYKQGFVFFHNIFHKFLKTISICYGYSLPYPSDLFWYEKLYPVVDFVLVALLFYVHFHSVPN